MFRRLFNLKSKGDIWVDEVEIKSEKVLAAGLNEKELQLIKNMVKYQLTSSKSKYNSDSQLIAMSYFNGAISTLHAKDHYDLSNLVYAEIEEQLKN